MIIAFSGKAQSGKTTASRMIQEKTSYKIYSLADPLKDICDEIFDFNDDHREGELKEIENTFRIKNWKTTLLGTCRSVLSDLIEKYTDHELISKFEHTVVLPFLIAENSAIPTATLSCSPRQVYQRFGTEFGRSLRTNIWIDLADRVLKENNGNLIIPDLRFNNEAEWVKSHSGKIILLERTDAGEVNSHVSESGIDQKYIDVTIRNNDSFDHFKDAIESCYYYYLDEPIVRL